MAFDGITIAAMVKELHLNLDGGRFNKIAQPEGYERYFEADRKSTRLNSSHSV